MTLTARFKNIQWGTVAWLTIVWMLLWGDISWGNAISGFLLGVLVVVVMPLPRVDFKGTIRPLHFLYLVVRFLLDLLLSSFQVAWQALQFGKTPRGAIVRVRLRSDSDLYMTLTSELSCLVPGSLVIEADPVSQTLYVHVLDLESYGGVDKVRKDVLALEARVMRALASKEELERAGVSLGRAALQDDLLAQQDSVPNQGAVVSQVTVPTRRSEAAHDSANAHGSVPTQDPVPPQEDPTDPHHTKGTDT